MELREQIARAICGNWVVGDDRPWQQWAEEADAVLEVMAKQEPVGYANGDDLDNMLDDRSAALFTHRDGFRSVPLYLAPGAQSDLNLSCKSVQKRLAAQWGYVKSGDAVPEGFQLVPIEPTSEMLDALEGSPWVIEGSISGNTFIRKEHADQRYVHDGWSAMLAAAPKPEKTE